MDENENHVQSTPSSSSTKKRFPLAHPKQLSKKKRTPLGELTNSLNITTANNSDNKISLLKYAIKDDNSPASSESTLDSDFNTQKVECEVTGGSQNNSENSPSTASTQKSVLRRCSYTSSIYSYLHSLEMEDNRRCLPNYMEEAQSDVSVNMRGILVDWLVDVAEEYRLVSDTLYLTVSYIDRFLSSHALSRHKLQLLGVSCMLVAAKYEEISSPHVENFCHITDNTYTKNQVLDMEKEVLQFLNYEMGAPTTINFLRILLKAAQENLKSPGLQFEFLSCYLAELSLLEYGCIRFLPSLIAASAIFLSSFTIQPQMHPWSIVLQCHSGYSPAELKDCVLAIHDMQLNRKGSSLRAVRDKYSQHKFKRVATLTPPSEVPDHYFEATDK